MISIHNVKQQVVENCRIHKVSKLTCQLPNLSPGQYQVIATYSRKYNEFAFRKRGKLELRANHQDTFTPEPTDLFPAQIRAQQIRDQWENGWLKWKQKKKVSPFFPRIEVNMSSSEMSMRLSFADDYDDVSEEVHDEYMLTALYNEDDELIDFCDESYSPIICPLPKQTPFRLTVLFIGTMFEQKYPIGFVLNGTYQDGHLTLSAPQYTRNTKLIKEKMAAIKKQEKHPEDEGLSLYEIFLLIVGFVLLFILIYEYKMRRS